MTRKKRSGAHPAWALSLLALLAAPLAISTPAAAAAPVFTGAIPDLAVQAGSSNLSVYDFGGQFSDPDGQTLTYQVVTGGGGSPVRLPYPTRDSWEFYITVNGTRIDLRVDNATAWGHSAVFLIRASDGTQSVESNEFSVFLTAPPVTARSWVSIHEATSALGGSRAEQAGCQRYLGLGTIAYPSDGTIVEFSAEVWRQPLDPSEPQTNGTTPSWAPYGTAGTLIAVSGGKEVLNVSVPETPTRVYLNASGLTALVQAAPKHFGMAWIMIEFTFCAENGSMLLQTRNGVEWLLRLPPGTDLSAPNPHRPELVGAVPNLNVSAGDPVAAAYDLAAYFDEADGDPVRYSFEFDDLAAAGEAGLIVTINGSSVDLLAQNASWEGNLTGRFVAQDPFRATASSNNITIRVLPPYEPEPATPPPPAETQPQAAAQGTLEPEAAVAVVVVVAAAVAVVTFEAARYAILAALFGVIAARGRRPSLLDHFVRGQIFQIVKDNPGIHFMEILRRSGVANGTASHHLRVLEKGGLVRVVHDGMKTRFYETGQKPDERDYGLLPADRQVLDAVAATPGIDQVAVAAQVGLSKSRVNRSVHRLTLLGLLQKSREGRSTRLFPRNQPLPTAVRPFPDATD